MNIRKKGIIYCLSVIVILLSACSASHQKALSITKESVTETQRWSYTSKEIISTMAMVDGMLVYHDVGNSVTEFYTLNLDTEEETNIGAVSNYVMNGSAAKLNNGMVYLYITTDEEESGMVNNLYKIDCKNNQLSRLSCDKKCTPMISLFGVDGNLISLKNVNDEDNYSYFELINPVDGSSTEVLRSGENEMYVSATVANGYLYALCYDELFSGEFSFYIRVYSLNDYEQKDIISLDNIIEYLIEARIGTMNIFKEYILFENFSNVSLLCKIENGGVSEILKDRDLVFVSDTIFENMEEYIFYIRGTDQCFVFDSVNEVMSAVEMDVADGYGIQKIFVDGEKIAVKEKLYEDIKRTEEKGTICLFDYQYFLKDKG